MSFYKPMSVESLGTCEKAEDFYEFNREPILRTILLNTEPPTEVLADDDEGPDFVAQKRRNRRSSKASISSTNGAPAQSYPKSKRIKTKSCSFVEDVKGGNIFVDEIPAKANKEELVEAFSKFGKVTDAFICNRAPLQSENVNSNFAFVSFKSESAAKAALSEAEAGIYVSQNRVRVTRRRHSATAASWPKPSLPKKVEEIKVGHQIGSEWLDILESFDWRHSAAMYLFRALTMEDYVRNFVHALASVRNIGVESIADLTEKLFFLAENRPKEADEMMPPSISGLVCNQRQDNCFDIRSILQPDKNLFLIENNRVHYMSTVPVEDARRKLKEILLEGLFIYFFAKFNHVPTFHIRNSYYLKSEPIRSTLMTVMGLTDVIQSLKSFFNFFSEVFVFKDKKSELRLKVDLYSKVYRDRMKEFLTPDQPKMPIESPMSLMVESSGDSWEEIQSSSPESDAILPFAMDPEMEVRNLLGHVRGIFSENSGAIEFVLHGQREEAFFCQRDVYVDGQLITDLWAHLQVGSEVYLDVEEEQDGRCFRYRAQLVWVGDKPNRLLSTQKLSVDESLPFKIDDLTRHLCRDLEAILEPAEIAQSITMMPCFDMPTDMEDLPNSVQSVVYDVLREDHGHSILSNPVVIDDVLHKLESVSGLANLSIQEKKKIKVEMEIEFRHVFAKCLADHCHV